MSNSGTNRHSRSGSTARWLAGAVLALGLCGMAQAQEPEAALTPEQSREALEFLSQLSAQADDTGRLLLAYSTIADGLIGQAPYLTAEQTLLELKQSLAASNVSLEGLFQPPKPTGDALFDRYALAVDQCMLSQAGLRRGQ